MHCAVKNTSEVVFLFLASITREESIPGTLTVERRHVKVSKN
jgi:hypothetical protein